MQKNVNRRINVSAATRELYLPEEKVCFKSIVSPFSFPLITGTLFSDQYYNNRNNKTNRQHCTDSIDCTIATNSNCAFRPLLSAMNTFSVNKFVPQRFYRTRFHVARIVGANPLLLARFRAGRRLRLYPFTPRMALCGDFLRFQHFVADRALLVPASHLLARRGFIDYPLARSMPCRGDFFIRRIVTARACFVCSPTCLGTRCLFSFVMDYIVPQCFYGTSLHMARVVGANPLFLARFRAGRRLCLRPLAPRMACSRDFLRFQHFVADRALLVSASRLLARRGGIYYPFACCMAGCRDFLICRIITVRACFVCSPARLGTRCRLPVVMDYIVPQCFYGTSLYMA